MVPPAKMISRSARSGLFKCEIERAKTIISRSHRREWPDALGKTENLICRPMWPWSGRGKSLQNLGNFNGQGKSFRHHIPSITLSKLVS